MIDVTQWAISLGRLDVNTTFMTLESFRAEHRQGYLDNCKIFASYLNKFKWDTIRISTEEPSLSSVSTNPCDWVESVHGKVKELTPHDVHVSLGNHVVTTIYHDSNLFHNAIIGKSVSGVLHVASKTSADWHSKK